MSDKTLTDTTGDEDELIAVETPPAEDKTPPAKDAAPAADADEDDDDDHGDDDGDTRTGHNAEADEAEITGKAKTNRERRLQRRQQQRIARENAEREMQFLRAQLARADERLRAVEGSTIDSHVQTIEQRLAQAQAEARQAERIIAKAVEAGNGDDVATAIRLRDEAVAEANQLTAARQQALEAKQRAAAPRGPDPRVSSLATEWATANPWFNANGTDEESVIAKAIDNQLAREGYNPADITYWQELTNRVSARFNSSAGKRPAAPVATRGKEPPPQGGTREHAPPSTRKEIYVTPERKQAMIDAGAWDDPVRRAKMLKAYQAYDQSSAR